MRARFSREVAAAGLPSGPGPAEPVTEADISSLPEPVRRYLRFMGVVGRPRDWSFRAGVTGRFRLGPDQAWKAMEAWQYNTRLEIARIFHIRICFLGLVPVLARDTYLRGEGRMLVRPLDLFTAEDARGAELDIGELVTYLNDAILLAPSLVLGSESSWSAVDDRSFDVALTDRGRTVTARVFLDERGAPRDFSTTDRFCQDPHDPKRPFVRTRWTTPIDGWQELNGRPVPTSGRAVWHLPQGDFAYVEMRFSEGSLAFNVPPGG
ncbi:DUF6544 family protein [Vitiosangium sp. GDMCC 1.1324]|uniref:DUF6544 family protein n=1 Tax=Vitiosangium sp. (strain GDMCC 1.1324) TaxID=2138576 RepID=UPI000D33CBE3|nr:DUF6544 family protein [Vitiosangium sp. GDMCC 1.1324]PTL82752.1 hypothetical protein DAT35_18465 [Vitiosangium sp. GDMCC 1.1324]